MFTCQKYNKWKLASGWTYFIIWEYCPYLINKLKLKNLKLSESLIWQIFQWSRVLCCQGINPWKAHPLQTGLRGGVRPRANEKPWWTNNKSIKKAHLEKWSLCTPLEPSLSPIPQIYFDCLLCRFFGSQNMEGMEESKYFKELLIYNYHHYTKH